MISTTKSFKGFSSLDSENHEILKNLLTRILKDVAIFHMESKPRQEHIASKEIVFFAKPVAFGDDQKRKVVFSLDQHSGVLTVDFLLAVNYQKMQGFVMNGARTVHLTIPIPTFTESVEVELAVIIKEYFTNPTQSFLELFTFTPEKVAQ